MSVGLKFLDGTRWDADMRLVDTQDTMSFLHVLEKLWGGRPRNRRKILQVGMAFSDLVAEAGHTSTLFGEEEHRKRLYDAMDKLNVRFGRQAVYFASGHKARDRGGMHIAFNHIPDPETER
jgi:DNA polymerase-4